MAVSERHWWLASGLVSLGLAGVLIIQWAQMNRYDVQRHQQLVDAQATERFIDEHWDRKRRLESPDAKPARRVRTGIFIQSLKFFNSAEVNLSGYLWQQYLDGEHDDIKPAAGEVGFVFPERVDSSEFTEVETYRQKTTAGEVIGWYFEATIRQPFDYLLYPFDHKTVSVRMWHKDFARNVVLVPDYQAYDATGLDDIFGIEKSIVLDTWKRHDTYFNYRLSSYDTNFGLRNYVGQQDFPELHYNFVIQRKFENAFIVHLLPLFLVAALLFGMLLTVSDDKDLASRHGFSTSAMIGACSALFFVVLLAHIQLREQFAGSSVVYLEYFYIVMYVTLALSAAYTYLFAQRALKVFPFNRLQNALIVKLLYWPLLLGALFVVTVVMLSLRG